MTTRIAKSWTFDASHQIHHHDGKCANLHGHTYRVTVEVEGDLKELDGSPNGGMVEDFYVLTQAWKKVEPLLDHQHLNDSLLGMVPTTTSEWIATWLLGHFLAEVPGTVAVTVAETESSWARVSV